MYSQCALRVAAFIAVSCISFSAQALEGGGSGFDVMVMFRPGVAEYPGGISAARPAEVRFSQSRVSEILLQCNAQYILRAVPDFQRADTLQVTRTGEIVRVTDWSDTYIIKLNNPSDANSVSDLLNDLPEVMYAGLLPIPVNACMSQIPPNDPQFYYQIHLRNSVLEAGYCIDVYRMWSITTGDPNITIGFVEEGLNANHPDLYGKVSGDVGYTSFTRHGTSVAGVAAAIANNNVCGASVNWGARINIQSTLESGYVNAFIEAINTSQIVNCSQCVIGEFFPLNLAVSDAYKRNKIVVAAMGYHNLQYPSDLIWYPAAYDRWGVIAVGGTSFTGDATFWSNYGNHIDVSALGDKVWTLDSLGGMDQFSGNSYSTPMVAGAAGLLLSYAPYLYNDDIERLLELSALDVVTERPEAGPGWDRRTGYGIIKVYETFKLLQPPYAFNHYTSGGVGASSTLLENEYCFFYNVAGLTSGYIYVTDIYRVSKTVYFEKLYAKSPDAWGRGAATRGFEYAYDNYGVGCTEVTDVTKTSCKLTTYVYKVYYDLNTGASAWFPCEPSQVQFAYSVLGIEDLTPPNVSVICPNGMEYYKTGQTIPIDWNVIDEYLQGIMCSVSINYESGNGIWVVLGSNIPVDEEGHGQFSYHIPSGQPSAKEHCRIRVIANDTNYHQGIDMSDSDFTIEYLQKPDGEPIPNNGNAEIPENHFLATPVPNPFNPSTDIRFGIKEPAVISLRIFDVAGRVVKTFYRDSYLPAGMYHEVWNGLDDNGVPVDSGVFFLQFKAGSFIETRKLVLMK